MIKEKRSKCTLFDIDGNEYGGERTLNTFAKAFALIAIKANALVKVFKMCP